MLYMFDNFLTFLKVFESLTPNAKEIYLLIVNDQMKAVEEQGLSFYQGLSFKDLYRYFIFFLYK